MSEVGDILEFSGSSALDGILVLNGAIAMKIYLRIFVALVLIVGTLFWAVNSVRSLSYSGTDLKLDVGAGAVTVTNPSEIQVPVQLVSPGTRVFSVTSTIDGVSGSSTTQGTGRDRTQLFEFVLPFGVSQFTVTRGTNVSLVANAGNNIQVTVQPLLENDARTTAIVAAVVTLAALFYISRTTNHRWIPILGRKLASDRAAKLASLVSVPSGQGSVMRAYGDNRASVSE